MSSLSVIFMYGWFHLHVVSDRRHRPTGSLMRTLGLGVLCLLGKEELKLSLKMVHLVEMVSDHPTFSTNNKSIYTPIGAHLMVNFNPDDFEFTFIALLVLAAEHLR